MKLAFGTVQLGMDYGIQGNGRPSLKDAEKLLDAAVGSGISVFDTAADYGNAEELLGDYLARRGLRDSVRIVTKLQPDVLDGVPPGEYGAVLENRIARSLRRLKTDRIDGLLFHSAGYVFHPDAVKALADCRRSGAVEKTGVSVYTPREADEALGSGSLDLVQVPYNILDRRLDRSGFFRKAAERGATVFARSSLLQGLLAMPPERLPGFMGFAAPYIRRFRVLCGELSLSPLECAVGFAAAHPDIDYLVFGADRAEQLEEYVRAAAKPLSPEAYRAVLREFRDVPERVVTPYLWKEGGLAP